MSRPRLLLISPVFHGYWRSISDAFERAGYDVISHLYDDRSLRETIRYKLSRELPARLGIARAPSRTASLHAAVAIRRAAADVVLAIRCDELHGVFWEAMAQHPRSVLWLYDEIRRTNHSSATLGAATAIATYSERDLDHLRKHGHVSSYVPNAYDPHIPVNSHPALDRVTFIGARYPNRAALLRTLQANSVPVCAVGRDWSNHAVDRLRTWRLRGGEFPSRRDVPRADAYGLMQASIATVNLHHNQDGFTMRTFEAAGVGAVQLIDRPDVAELYEPDKEIAVFTTPEEAVELAHRAQTDTAWANNIRIQGRKRTLAEHTFDHRVAELERLWQ